MRNWLKRIAESRFRISTRLFSGIGSAVVLTVAASWVGWFSINRVGDCSDPGLTKGSVPAMVVAFEVAQNSGELVAAAPRITAATTENLESVSADIDQTYAALSRNWLLWNRRPRGLVKISSYRVSLSRSVQTSRKSRRTESNSSVSRPSSRVSKCNSTNCAPKSTRRSSLLLTTSSFIS